MEISAAASELGGAEKLLSDLSSVSKGFYLIMFKSYFRHSYALFEIILRYFKLCNNFFYSALKCFFSSRGYFCW